MYKLRSSTILQFNGFVDFKFYIMYIDESIFEHLSFYNARNNHIITIERQKIYIIRIR